MTSRASPFRPNSAIAAFDASGLSGLSGLDADQADPGVLQLRCYAGRGPVDRVEDRETKRCEIEWPADADMTVFLAQLVACQGHLEENDVSVEPGRHDESPSYAQSANRAEPP